MITFLDDDFSQLNHYIKNLEPSLLLILVDENTHHFCLPQLITNLETEIPYEIIEIEAGEELKTISTAAHLWEILAEFKTDRNALMLNLGGGVITDLGGFVASTYKRGINFINIPTSLLGMCDASIGGKTGIDHSFLKNIVGTFASAEQIFVFPTFLKTLPPEQLRSGFAEMLKHGLIADETHWKTLIAITEISVAAIASHILTSMKIKQRVVEEDFKEENIRKTLNFGHTFGHAFESLFLKSGALIPHGDAVAMGMICETHLSYLQNFITQEDSERVIQAVQYFFPYRKITNLTDEDILQYMMNDKKNLSGAIKFSLLEKIGQGNFDIKVPDKDLLRALNYYRNLDF